MAKFEFSLKGLLKMRQIKEDEAKRNYAVAEASLKTVMDKINSMYRQIDEARVVTSKLESKGGDIGAMAGYNDAFIRGINKMIEQEKYKARELMMDAEEKRDLLVEASREKKLLEILKEKQYQEFKKLQKKVELKQLDEIVGLRYKRGKQ